MFSLQMCKKMEISNTMFLAMVLLMILLLKCPMRNTMISRLLFKITYPTKKSIMRIQNQLLETDFKSWESQNQLKKHHKKTQLRYKMILTKFTKNPSICPKILDYHSIKYLKNIIKRSKLLLDNQKQSLYTRAKKESCILIRILLRNAWKKVKNRIEKKKHYLCIKLKNKETQAG